MGEVYPNHVTCFPEEVSPAYCALVPAEPDVNVCEGVGLYVPRNPAESILYRVVAAELENFLERQRLRDRHVPLNVIFGVFAGVALLSVLVVLLIRPRDPRELGNG